MVISVNYNYFLFPIVTGGCSHQNGDCSHFCFTVPNTTDPLYVSSSVQCACRTGFTLNNDGKRCIEGKYMYILHTNDTTITIMLKIL